MHKPTTPNVLRKQARKRKLKRERRQKLLAEAERRGITPEALAQEKFLEGETVRTRIATTKKEAERSSVRRYNEVVPWYRR